MSARSPLRVRLVALAAGLGLAACGWASISATGASAPIVVAMDVPSAITLTNGCTGDPARRFGIVQPGTSALTATGSGVCSVAFQSTNDSSMLRVGQSDSSGTAMGVAGTNASRVAGTSELRAVTMASATVGHAVGQSGRIMRTTNGGATWSNATSPTGQNLLGVDAPSALVAYAAGFSGRMVKTTDGGANWATLPASPGGVIEAIDAVSDSNVFAARDGSVWESVDGGGSWTNLNVPTTNGFGPISAFDSDTTVVAGWSGSVSRRDGGAWTSVNVSSPFAIHDLEFSTASVVWAVGEAGVRRSVDAGATWADVSPPGVDEALRSITTTSASVAVVAGDRGETWSTADAGATWTRLTPPTVNSINGMDRVGNTIVTVGSSETVQYSADAGASWSAPASLGDTMLDVDAQSRLVALAVGGRGTIRTTVDGGVTWTSRSAGTTRHLRSVDLDSGRGWLVGDNGTIMRTVDGGATWTPQTSGTTADLYAVSTVSRSEAWVVGDAGTILRTSNGGASWQVQASGLTTANLRAVRAVSDQVAWLVGRGGTVARTTNGGSTWTLRPAGTTLDLVGVAGVTATEATALTMLSGVIRTADAGGTWTSPGGIRQNYDIDIEGDATYTASVDTVRQQIGTSPEMVVHWSFDTFYAIDAVDENTVFAVGDSDVGVLLDAPVSFPDYGAGSLWSSGSAASLFGICLQSVGVGTTADWTVDATGTAGQCEPNDSDPWRAVPTASSKAARVTTIGVAGRADFVFGVKVGQAMPAGRYTAGVSFEALAPDV
ncbi:MAG: hypothetical protein JWM86_540 [Thermoleophilia bacterium]|nr:hypothetical protein [Thermoleophilia bacterium]